MKSITFEELSCVVSTKSISLIHGVNFSLLYTFLELGFWPLTNWAVKLYSTDEFQDVLS